MKLPSFKALQKTDYEDQYQKLIDTLSISLNNGIEVLYDALNRRTTLRENISCTVKDITVVVDTLGIPKSSTIIKTDLSTKVDGCQVIYALNQTNSNAYVSTSGGPFVSFDAIQGGIKINHIAGLIANNSYLLRVVVYQQ